MRMSSHISDNFYAELIETIKKESPSKREIARAKIRLCAKYKLKKIPTDIDVLLRADKEDIPLLRRFLQTKPTRTGSGVAVCAVMTKPMKCPHGKCAMCPGGIGSAFGTVPQSYTGREPATLRGIRNDYDAYLQVMNRLEQYMALGHAVDKIELIVMGGTFPSFPKHYQESFVRDAFQAMNDFSKLFFRKNGFNITLFKDFFEMPGDIHDKSRTKRIQKRLLSIKRKWKSNLVECQKENESSRVRCVAMCIETRPDYCRKSHISQMLKLGTTRVELGVQTVYNDVLKKIRRGHSVEDSIEATRLLKDSLLKVGYHMMPGLPGVTKKADVAALLELIRNPDFRPDALKIYPCMVLKGTRLYKLWKQGYKPLTTEEAANIIIEFKKRVPEYMRIMRVQRDIPTEATEAGVGMTNLRQYVEKVMKEKNLRCRCIRCREPRNKDIAIEAVAYKRFDYTASGSQEVFLSAEDPKNDILLGFCRLRLVNNPFRKEIKPGSAGIRELHVYGEAVPIGVKPVGAKGKVQHRGIGKRLVRMAESIAKQDFDARHILVISGVGVRDYYRKLGYRRKGVYMAKRL